MITGSAQFRSNDTEHHNTVPFMGPVLRCGRMEKFKDVAASYAPALTSFSETISSVFRSVLFFVRAPALGFGTAIAPVLLPVPFPGGAGVAFAADECGVYVGPNGTIGCNIGTYTTGPGDDIVYNSATIDGIVFDISGITLSTATPAVTVWNGTASSNPLVFTGDSFDITTTTAGDQGLNIYQRGAGTADATITSGTISTAANGAYGILYRLGSSNTNTANLTLGAGLQVNTAGNAHGVFIDHFGTGDIHLISEASVYNSGLNEANALRTISRGGNTLIEVNSGVLETNGGNSHGIFAWAPRGGDVKITSSASIITHGHTSQGVSAWITDYNGSTLYGGDVNIDITSAGSITTTGENSFGVLAWTAEAGAVSVTHAGTIDILGGSTTWPSGGIYARSNHASNAADVSVTVADTGSITTAGPYGAGVIASHAGSGAVNVASAGMIQTAGSNADGIIANSMGGIYNVDVTGGTITSGTDLAAGIHTAAVAGGTIDISAGAAINSSASGIAIRDGDIDYDGVDETGGDAIVTTAGNVTGDTLLGLGNDAFSLEGGIYTGTILGDDIAASNSDGNDTFNWTGGTLAGGFNGQNGSDMTLVSATTYDGSQILDGGDDLSTIDGWIDSLTFQGLTVTTAGANLTNWENIIIDGGMVSFSDNMLATGSNAGTGLTITNAGTIDAGMAFALKGNMTLNAGATFDGTGAGTGVYTISGDLANNGIVTTQDGAVGDTITIAGDYSGVGTLMVDVDTATDTADVVTVSGNSSGTTLIAVNNLSPGNATGHDITVVDVEGTSSEGDFMLAGGTLTAGAFDYGLEYQLGSFILAQQLNSVGAIYEASPAVLAGFIRMPTLEQRVGKRQWGGSRIARRELSPTRGDWIRVYGERLSMATDTGVDIYRNLWGLQAGYDAPMEPGENGQWIFGATAQYGLVNGSVASDLGAGVTNSEGFGIGVTATWYGDDATYFDLQGQANWIFSDFSSSSTGLLGEGEKAKAYSLSVEGGHRFELSQTESIVPQAQLVWGFIDGATFTDSVGNAVDLGTHSALTGRIGLAYEYENNDEVEGAREKVYVIGNLLHDFSNGSTVTVSGDYLSANTADTWGEIGAGGSITWDENKTLYGEASYRSALGGSFGADNALALTAGVRIQW